MLLDQLFFAIGELLLKIPPLYYLLIFILFFVVVIVISLIFKYHLKKYTFQTYKTGMIRLVYISGLGILGMIGLILLGLIFSQT